jgi:hypothetical protein
MAAGEAPLGPRKLDIGALTDEQFQEMCGLLVRLEFPDARSTDNPDGGADTLLARPEGGWERGWQAKRYTGTIYWGKCRDSLDRAVANYGIDRMTFCFARNLTVGQETNFQKKLVGKHPGVTVDYWNKDEIVARLNGSEEGQRIARHYFGDPAGDKQLMLRAIRARGELETADDAIERSRPVGEFLKGHDPFFTYPAASYEDGYDLSGHPEAVMSVFATESGVTERIDAVPRDNEALERYPTTVRFSFTEDPAGRRAGEAMHKALRENRAFEGEERIETTFENVPPLFEEKVGKVERARVVLTPKKPVPAPWVAEMNARSDRWRETVTMNVEIIDPPPEGWDIAFEGQYAGLTLSILAAWRGTHGEQKFNWRREASSAPADDQARALRFIAAMHGPGEFVMRDLVGGRPELRQKLEPTEVEDLTVALLELMENVVVIEDWSGETIAIPESFTGQDAHDVAIAAARVRTRELPVTFTDATIDVLPEAIEDLRAGRPVKIEQTIGVYVFGREVPLGRGQLMLPPYEIEDLGPGEVEGTRKIILRPVGGPASVAYELHSPRESEPAASS